MSTVCLGCILLYWLNKEGIDLGVGDGANTKTNQNNDADFHSRSFFPSFLPFLPPSPSLLFSLPLFSSPSPFLLPFLPSFLKTGSPYVAWPALTSLYSLELDMWSRLAFSCDPSASASQCWDFFSKLEIIALRSI